MSRKRREWYLNVAMNITSRGNRKTDILENVMIGDGRL